MMWDRRILRLATVSMLASCPLGFIIESFVTLSRIQVLHDLIYQIPRNYSRVSRVDMV